MKRHRDYAERFNYTRFVNLYTVSDIARKYDVTPATVSNWIRRYDSFPAPIVINVTGGFAMWSEPTIEKWYNETVGQSKKSLVKRRAA